MHLPRIAIALMANDADEVLMLLRDRFTTDQWGYELLGGLVDEGEESAATAAGPWRSPDGLARCGGS